ncbi:MAG: hypothetical protein H6710_16435 [Myxococcales bacterium]|nr:hypothetical protein [Myxococcales bacterium]MCB9706574.1 hypothetical protein [Myxococcales bacterium]
MAKPIIVNWKGVQSSFRLEKLDRAKLYGKRQRQVLDPGGERCERAELTRDGSLLIRSGMTAQGYFDGEGLWVANRDLVGLDEKGEPLPQVGSTLGVEQPLAGPVDPSEVLDLAVRSVYVLTPEGLDPDLQKRLLGGEVFRFPFNYRADYNAETAFLIGNKSGFFALVGQPAPGEWCELETVAAETYDDAGDDDELDFEMF